MEAYVTDTRAPYQYCVNITPPPPPQVLNIVSCQENPK